MNEIEKRGLLWTAKEWRERARELLRKWSPEGTCEVQNEAHARSKWGDERTAKTLDECAEAIEGLCE